MAASVLKKENGRWRKRYGRGQGEAVPSGLGAEREALPAGSEGLSPAHLLVLAKGTAKYRGLRQGVLGRFKGQQEQQSGRME